MSKRFFFPLQTDSRLACGTRNTLKMAGIAAVRDTADDAHLSKVSAASKGYLTDPYVMM